MDIGKESNRSVIYALIAFVAVVEGLLSIGIVLGYDSHRPTLNAAFVLMFASLWTVLGAVVYGSVVFGIGTGSVFTRIPTRKLFCVFTWFFWSAGVIAIVDAQHTGPDCSEFNVKVAPCMHLEAMTCCACVVWLCITLLSLVLIIIRGPGEADACSDLCDELWGRGIPVKVKTIAQSQLDACNPDDRLCDLFKDLDVSGDFDYHYMENTDRISIAFGLPSFARNLVIRDEYTKIFKKLEAMSALSPCSVLITGQHGVGKTTFLTYIFVELLKKRRPTAIQVDSSSFIVFNRNGAKRYSVYKDPDIAWASYWVLVDGNGTLHEPCRQLQQAKCVVYLASPETPASACDGWVTQQKGQTIVMDLPNVVEIAAALDVQGLDPRRTRALMYKWGPSIRTISALCCGDTNDTAVTTVVNAQASDLAANLDHAWICSGPNIFPARRVSSILYVRRACGIETNAWRSYCVAPTEYLWSVIYEARPSVSTLLDIYELFSTHAATRLSGGWMRDLPMHMRLINSERNIPIFGANSKTMRPSKKIIPGTLKGLRQANVRENFYWLPCSLDVPGIDAVLSCKNGDVFALQGSLRGEPVQSLEGLKRLRYDLRRHALSTRKWHFVIVVKDKFTAQICLQNFRSLGSELPFPVEILACVM